MVSSSINSINIYTYIYIIISISDIIRVFDFDFLNRKYLDMLIYIGTYNRSDSISCNQAAGMIDKCFGIHKDVCCYLFLDILATTVEFWSKKNILIFNIDSVFWWLYKLLLVGKLGHQKKVRTFPMVFFNTGKMVYIYATLVLD